jgi:nitroreductase
MNDIIKSIKKRRSIRKYTAEKVPDEIIRQILEAGRWAPSGLNNQPWKFAVIRDQQLKEKLSGLTHYKRIIVESNVCIAVFLNIPSGYNRDKDCMAIGACIQNMLLAAESLSIGCVWLGEILNKKEQFNEIVGIDSENELMAVIAMGHPDESPSKDRKDLDEFLIKEL